MKSHALLEREFDLDVSISMLTEFIQSEFINFTLNYEGDLSKTYFCKFEDLDGVKSTGMGKGYGKQSIASALSEAIEHYYYENDTSPSINLEIPSCHSEAWFARGSPNFKAIVGDKKISIDHYTYCNVRDESKLYYPAFLGNPSYRPTTIDEKNTLEKYSLIRYSCNTGTASGMTYHEALLHGILECIERDSIGMSLINNIIKKEPDPIKVFDRETLPEDILGKISEIEGELSCEIKIYNITTDLLVPTVLTSLTKDDGGVFFGSGSSLYLDYAVERSLMESVQCVHGQIRHGFHYPKPTSIIPLNDLPKYTKCFMDRGYFVYKDKEIMESYSCLLKANADRFDRTLSVEGQVDLLCRMLHKNSDVEVFARDVYRSDKKNSPFVVQALLPSLERFYLVASGLYVLPSARGESAACNKSKQTGTVNCAVV